MPDSKAAAPSKAKRALAALGLIAAGFAIALALTCLLSPVIGPPLVHYNNAHRRGKFPEADAWLSGAVVIVAVSTLAGLALVIVFRKRRNVRNLSLGFFLFNVAGIVAFILLYMMIAAILRA